MPNRVSLPGDEKQARNFHRKSERRTGAQKRKQRGRRAGFWQRGRRGSLVGRR